MKCEMPTRTRARGHVYLGDPSEYAEKLGMTPMRTSTT